MCTALGSGEKKTSTVFALTAIWQKKSSIWDRSIEELIQKARGTHINVKKPQSEK